MCLKMQIQQNKLRPYPYLGGSGFIPLNLFHQDTFKVILGGSRNIRKRAAKLITITFLIPIKSLVK